MDGSYEPVGHYSRHAFQSASQSGAASAAGDHLGLDYSMMDAPFQPGQGSAADIARSPNNGTYESHDDLCLDRCTGVGLYNGNSQYFNHRGASSGMPPRWSGRNMSLSHNTLYNFDLDLDAMQPVQYRAGTGFAPSHSNDYQHWFGHQTPSGIHGSEEDCLSMDDHSMGGDSCCDSQCTMMGKCTNVACANKEDACTDQSCPSRPDAVPSEIADGAAALIMINHAPEPQQHSFDMRPPVMSALDFTLAHSSSAPQQTSISPLDLLPNSVGNITSHLLAAHRDLDSSDCIRPCPLDDPHNYPNCHMPIIYEPFQFTQYESVGSHLQISQELPVCGAEIRDPEAFLAHFNAQHRPFFVGNPQPPSASSGTLSDDAVLPSTENISQSPVTPFDTSDSGASINTPSPLTPLSQGQELPDTKARSPSPARSTSVESSSSDPLIGSDHGHTCLWREDGSSDICGEVFTDPGELFTHTVNNHIRCATKGTEGFRCAWKDCPRSEAGAPGFPQRSKIERHMQTHIGHKPHVCPTCHKGFSAKQALNQHMFIHTDQKPLECATCKKTFRYPSALTMHQRVHSGAKPLKCPVCGKMFSESSNLSKHKRTHEVKGRFNCNVMGCDRNFHRQDQLRRHMKTHYKEGVENSRQMDMLATKFDIFF
ncbi:hypothetical protein B0T22DRAFT_53353 [Podospora appendiculata]|uniref:C2H2-type domain-containing protein n=1 Tax=Podospora appendiculata TaxID=314037 RepID=A0AAE1CGU3_9PEZI|nr:hypothetical protein B0T22DRAFT_53353 [Podospora appendiculata]